MGDVTTHAEIAEAVLLQLPAEPEVPFFEIGNWLTDVSQFRVSTPVLSDTLQPTPEGQKRTVKRHDHIASQMRFRFVLPQTRHHRTEIAELLHGTDRGHTSAAP